MGRNDRVDKEATATPSQNGQVTEGWAQGTTEDEHVYVKGRQLLVIMISVLLGILLAALDQTIVGPALPKIIADLGGFEHYSWVVTVYLLTTTITVPIFGKLSDMYGRKWFYIAGIAIFLVGSGLCGVSQDMFQLIMFRGIQGLGAGMLTAIAFTIIADLIPPADRGKWQGMFGAVFGLASVVGPFIGGSLTDGPGWRYVFYVNIPIGLIAIAVLLITFPHESRHHVKKVIDWLGVGTLVAGLTPLLLALSLGGTTNKLTVPMLGTIDDWRWGSPTILTLLVIAAIFLVAFVFVEARAKEPIIPLDLFKNSIFRISVITVFLTGVGLFGAVLYIPLFIQAIQGDSALDSGNSVIPMTMAIVLSSIVTGQIISRTGKYRIIGILGMGFVTAGMFLLYTMNIETPRLTTILYMIIMGLGLGVAFPLYTLAVQNAFSIQRVGVVTSAIQFFRSVGSTVGVAVLGSVVNNAFHDRFPASFTAGYNALKAGAPAEAANQMPAADTFLESLSALDPQALVGQEGITRLSQELVAYGTPEAFVPSLIDVMTDAMKPALFAGIQQAFLIATVLLGLGLLATIFLKEIPLRKAKERPGTGMAEGAPPAEQRGKEMAASGMPGGSMLRPEDEPVVVRK
jgi:EmrB/QacA subfamily drug resistance transporter